MKMCIKQTGNKRMAHYKHGGKGTRLYSVWNSMKQRCQNTRDKEYHNYGARGIQICPEWRSDYSAFRSWALANGYREGLSIDRIDNNGNYHPGNCRWTTPKEQARNRRTTLQIEYAGMMRTLDEISRETGINQDTLYYRIFIYKCPKHLWYEKEHLNWKKVVRSDGMVFETAREAAIKSGVDAGKVTLVCQGKRRSTGGYRFSYYRAEAEAALAAQEGEVGHG